MAETGVITVRWQEAERFEGGADGRPAIVIDGASQVATSPVELLLVAAATCTGTDVVSILRKERVALESLEIRVSGSRRDTHPRRYTAIRFQFLVSGTGITEAKARRAIALSLEKYCSVVASLAPDIAVSYDLVLR